MSIEPLATFTDSNFDAEVMRSPSPVLVDFGAPVVVDFGATWCPPCRALAPVVAELAKQYAGRVKIGQLDIDESPRTATRYDVRSIPTLLLFVGGRVVGQLVGAVPRSRIEALVETSFGQRAAAAASTIKSGYTSTR
jgi:thioredoxin 1